MVTLADALNSAINVPVPPSGELTGAQLLSVFKKAHDLKITTPGPPVLPGAQHPVPLDHPLPPPPPVFAVPTVPVASQVPPSPPPPAPPDDAAGVVPGLLPPPPPPA